MDTQRIILLIIFSFSVLMLWEAWQREHRPPPAPQETAATKAGKATTLPGVPTPSGAAGGNATGSNASVPSPGQAAVPTAGGSEHPQADLIHVRTDFVDMEVSPIGGDIVRLQLLKHKDSIDYGRNFVLLNPEYQSAVQSGLIGDDLPNHKTQFTSSVKDYALKPGQDTLEVRLEASNAEGVHVIKTYTLKRSSYLIDVTQEIVNDGSKPISAHAYFQVTRDSQPSPGDTFMLKTFHGPAVYTEQDKYKKVSFSDIDKGKIPYPKNADNGWIAMVQHYFVTAFAPTGQTPREFYTRKVSDNVYSAGVIVPVATVAPGQTGKIVMPMYAGPQDLERLEKVAPGLPLVVDYGWLTLLAQPIFQLLNFIHGLVKNWGVAIILLTVLIKLVFYPLSAASYKSMARMKKVTPRLTKLREQYGNDRAKLNQAMMELYKVEKINPLGGCLPIVVQIPVFISLYWVLLGSVELRQAPFFGWITDLSAPDPFYILPALMMVSMFIQTKLNPTPPDPVQAKIMMFMPFAFGAMFFFFPAGLVLYWLVNNILSIAQQWQITRMLNPDTKKAA
jgi:YidC/Oxa1 family membrane protein insertase